MLFQNIPVKLIQSPKLVPNLGDINGVFTVQPLNVNFSLLVDSGSIVSVLPISFFEEFRQTSNSKLYAANGTEISTFGKKP